MLRLLFGIAVGYYAAKYTEKPENVEKIKGAANNCKDYVKREFEKHVSKKK